MSDDSLLFEALPDAVPDAPAEAEAETEVPALTTEDASSEGTPHLPTPSSPPSIPFPPGLGFELESKLNLPTTSTSTSSNPLPPPDSGSGASSSSGERILYAQFDPPSAPWLPAVSPAAVLPRAQRHLAALTGCGVSFALAEDTPVDEKEVAAAAQLLSRCRPESPTHALKADPQRYQLGEDIERALTLANAHCLLYDLFSADGRYDGDETYAGLVSRFLASLVSWPAVVSLVSDPEHGVKTLLGLQSLPSSSILALTESLSTPYGPGFCVGLRSNSIDIFAPPLGTLMNPEPKPKVLRGHALMALMKARNLVWSYTQDTLTECWFPWLFVEAGGLCTPYAQANVRMLAGMRFSLAMYARLHAVAIAANPAKCEKRGRETRVAYGLQTQGGMWHLQQMRDDGDSYPVHTVWMGQVYSPKQMAHALAHLRAINEERYPRHALVQNWLFCACGDSEQKESGTEEVAPTSSPKVVPQPHTTTSTSPVMETKTETKPAPSTSQQKEPTRPGHVKNNSTGGQEAPPARSRPAHRRSSSIPRFCNAGRTPATSPHRGHEMRGEHGPPGNRLTITLPPGANMTFSEPWRTHPQGHPQSHPPHAAYGQLGQMVGYPHAHQHQHPGTFMPSPLNGAFAPNPLSPNLGVGVIGAGRPSGPPGPPGPSQPQPNRWPNGIGEFWQPPSASNVKLSYAKR